MTPLGVALAALVIVAAAFDIRTRHIPNAVPLAGAIAGVALHTWLHSWAGLRDAGFGLLIGFALLLPIYLLKGMGGGDIKLMAAIGAVAGQQKILLIFVLTAIIGGVIAIVMLMVRGGIGRALRNVGHILASILRMRPPHEGRPDLNIDHPDAPRLPYAVPMAIASLLTLL